MQLSNHIKITKCADYASANTTEVDGTALDMAGYEGVIFFTYFATTNAGNYISVQQGTTSSPTSALEGTKVTSTGGGGTEECVWVDVYRPAERYVRCVAIRAGASTALGEIWAIQYGARAVPVDNATAGTIQGEAHVSPAEGTI